MEKVLRIEVRVKEIHFLESDGGLSDVTEVELPELSRTVTITENGFDLYPNYKEAVSVALKEVVSSILEFNSSSHGKENTEDSQIALSDDRD